MEIRETWEIAARLSRLHANKFKGKRSTKPVYISHENFYRVAARRQLRASKYKEVATALLQDHDLLLGRAEAFFILVAKDACTKWEEIPTGSVSGELKRKAPPAPAKRARSTARPEGTLRPATAWPFPTGNKP